MLSRVPTSKNSKILIETSVLLAGSILAEIPDIGEPIKDEFYEASQRLFSLIRKNIADKLGVTTQTVEEEAFHELQDVVKRLVNKRARDIPDWSKLFPYYSSALNICGERMKKLRNCLLREALMEEEVEANVFTIRALYYALENYVKTDQQIEEEVMMKYPTTTDADMRRAAALLRQELANVRKRDNIQYRKLKDKHVDPNDITILAEAMHILSQYKAERGPEFKLYLASTDTNHFVPVRDPEGESGPVTRTILHKTGVTCAWPDDILREFEKEEEVPVIEPAEVQWSMTLRHCSNPKCGRLGGAESGTCPTCGAAFC